MINAIIVDDEELVLELLYIQLQEQGEINIVGKFNNPLEALENIPYIKPDVVFLDVEMPSMSGIELGTEIIKYDDEIEIVFVTAYDKYAVDAFKLNALNYILKPVDMDSIIQTIERIKKKQKNIINQSDIYKIEVFGGISVLDYSGKPIKWITSKSEELFAILILNRKFGISKWEIIENIWPDHDIKKAEQNLYTTIFRLKKTFKESGININIENNKGRYNIKTENIYCDLFEFDYFITKNIKINEKTINEYNKILTLYKGDLFGDRAYIWSIVSRERYLDIYLSLIKDIIIYYFENNEYNKALNLLKTTPYTEYDPEFLELKKILKTKI